MEEKEEKKNNKNGRVFIASLKWDNEEKSWTDKERIKEFLKQYNGTYEIYSIIHDKDIKDKETGELKEEHTHFVIISKTPRKLKTIANILNVNENMIQFAKSKKASIRYLIHLDDQDKYKYNELNVMTNSKTTYKEQVEKGEITDKEIFETIMHNGIKYTIMVYLNKVEMSKILIAIKLYKEIQQEEENTNIILTRKAIPKVEELKIKN